MEQKYILYVIERPNLSIFPKFQSPCFQSIKERSQLRLQNLSLRISWNRVDEFETTSNLFVLVQPIVDESN